MTFQWTRIIDSFASSQADEAAFSTLENGDDLEYGEFNNEGTLVLYEEVWRDVTPEAKGNSLTWILQSLDGSVFLGKICNIFLAMQQKQDKSFSVRKEELRDGAWVVSFESGLCHELPKAEQIVLLETSLEKKKKQAGDMVQVGDSEYVIRGIEIF